MLGAKGARGWGSVITLPQYHQHYFLRRETFLHLDTQKKLQLVFALVFVNMSPTHGTTKWQFLNSFYISGFRIKKIAMENLNLDFDVINTNFLGRPEISQPKLVLFWNSLAHSVSKYAQQNNQAIIAWFTRSRHLSQLAASHWAMFAHMGAVIPRNVFNTCIST